MRRAAPVGRLAALLLAALLPAGLLPTACSSAPAPADSSTEVKNRAAEAARSGNDYYRQGRYELALQFFAQALNENASIDNQPGVVQSYNSVGRTYLALGRLDEAEAAFREAAANAASLDDEARLLTEINLGELALRRGDAPGALAAFERLLGEAGAGTPPEQLGLLYHDLGSAYKATGDLGRALEWLENARAINLGAKLYEEAAADSYMIASVHSKRGDWAAAAENASRALEYDKRMENTLGIVKDLAALGTISAKAGDAAAAYDYFRRSYLAASALESTPDIRSALEGLVAAGEALGKTAETAAYREALANLGSP